MDKLKSFITALCFFITTSVCIAQNEIISHGISTFGDLKYEKDFKHLSYVNPDAQKEVKFLSGRLDRLTQCIRTRGREEQEHTHQYFLKAY